MLFIGFAGKVAFDMFIPEMLKANLAEPLMALILVLVLSASMSTLASLILISSSTVAIDLYKGHVKPVLINGLSHQTLIDLKNIAQGNVSGNLVEVMTCTQGCVGGPHSLCSAKTAAKRISNITKVKKD